MWSDYCSYDISKVKLYFIDDYRPHVSRPTRLESLIKTFALLIFLRYLVRCRDSLLIMFALTRDKRTPLSMPAGAR